MSSLNVLKISILILYFCDFVAVLDGELMPMLDFRYWRCVMKREWKCPDSEINFFLYTPERPQKQWIDVRRMDLLPVFGWKPSRRNVLIVHGFNGTHSKTPMSYLRDAYLSRKDYNVFMVDWSPLTRFPCYLSALSNTKLAAQCTAQLYSQLTQAGVRAKKITCVGHSLGAHVCGMMSNHLNEKQYKIIAPSEDDEVKEIDHKGGKAVLYQNHHYHRLRDYKNGQTVLRCASYRKTKCKGTITVQHTDGIGDSNTNH